MHLGHGRGLRQPRRRRVPEERLPEEGEADRGRPGSFKLQVVKTTSDGHTKFVRNGPKIHYQGQGPSNWANNKYKVEKFKTHVKIKAGQRLAIKTKETSMLRCSSGGPNTLLYSPVLKKPDGYRIYEDTDGCWMLIEGKVK